MPSFFNPGTGSVSWIRVVLTIVQAIAGILEVVFGETGGSTGRLANVQTPDDRRMGGSTSQIAKSGGEDRPTETTNQGESGTGAGPGAGTGERAV